MSTDISLHIKHIKNIKSFDYTFKLENGIYALVGGNATGKSTLMAILASTARPTPLERYTNKELSIGSELSITTSDSSSPDTSHTVTYTYRSTALKLAPGTSQKSRSLYGFYEGSIFSGYRFQKMNDIEQLLQDDAFIRTLSKSDPSITKALGRILHDDENYYAGLYKVRDMDTVEKYKLPDMPYFLKTDNGDYISSINMSAGESMLISILHFFFQLTNNRRSSRKSSYKTQRPFQRYLICIDEVELALHPISIDRLYTYIDTFIRTTELDISVIFSTHSSELIRRLSPRNMFYVENYTGNLSIINPCFPQYAIKTLNSHEGYDCYILVEDEIARRIVITALEDYIRNNNILIQVIPVGGWSNVLDFQKTIIDGNSLGAGKFVFSILDGDVKNDVNSYKDKSKKILTKT